MSETAEIPVSPPDIEAGGKEIEDLIEKYDKAVQLKSQFDSQCRAMYKLYASYYNRKSYKFINNVDIPLPFKLIETLTPFMCANMPNPNCTPVSKKDVDPAMRMDAVMKHYLRRPQNMIELTHAYKSMLTYSIGIIKDGWDYRKGQKRRWIKDMQELMMLASLTPGVDQYAQAAAMGDPGAAQAVVSMAQQGAIPGIAYDAGQQWFIVNDLDIHDAPDFQCIHPLDFFWYGIGDNTATITRLYHRYYKTKEDIEQMIIQKEDGFDTAALQHVIQAAAMKISTADDLQTQIGLISGVANCYELIECTMRDKTGKVVVRTFSKDANVIVGQWDSKYFHNQYNYSVIRMYPKKGEFVGTPLLKVVESLCAAVNQMGNQILDNGLLALHRVFIRRKGARSREKQYSLFAGAIIDGRPEDFKVLDIPDVRQNSLSMLQMFMGFIASITGVHDILDQPTPGGSDTAAGVEQLNFMNSARIKQQHFMDMQAINGLMERMASNIRQYVRQTMNIKVQTQGGSTYYIDIDPGDLVGDYSFEVDVKQMQASNSAVARAQLQTLLNMSVGLMRAYTDPATGQTSPRLIADVERLYKSILATYDNIGRPEQYVIDPSDTKAIPPQMIPPPQPQAPPGELPPQQMAPPGGAPPSLAKMAAAMPSASGAGLPPQMGGPQQNSVNNNYSNPMPKSASDVLQSARSLQ